MRLAVPSVSSKLHQVSLAAIDSLSAGRARDLPTRALRLLLDNGTELLFCRGRDVPGLVAHGVADAGLTGYDMTVEWMLGSHSGLDVRSWTPSRLSFVAFVAVPGRRVARIYTEYPEITCRWIASTRRYAGVGVVPLHGSSEGIIRADPEGGGVVLVTTGSTLRANDLPTPVPLLATDLCVVRRQPDGTAVGGVPLNSLPELGLPSFCGMNGDGLT